MKTVLATLVFWLITCFNFGAAQTSSRCIVNNTAFSIGEKVFYKVSYNWHGLKFNGGEVSFTVNSGIFENKPVYHMIGYGSSYKSYDWFFKVRDQYESYVDMETLQPLKFIRNVNEGGYSIYNNVTFKHDQQKAVSTHGTFNIPDCIQDVLSAIYYARNINFARYNVNDTIPVNLFLDDKIYPIYIRYIGKEQITTSQGTFRCIVFRPLLIKGTIFKGGEKMTVHVTDDENKIPVLVESPIVVGAVQAQMFRYEGIRNPLTAKVN
ncbi:MAG: DUF3108 domain-containing protein [Chitinophagales bacterium]|nr:DUF3108 domain-containing protein [Chitinophagales bacterium]